MPAVVNAMKEEATLVTLVKPQFEARRSQVSYILMQLDIYTHALRMYVLHSPVWM